MPEIIKILLPTNVYTFSIWILCVILIIFRSRKVSTKWFTLDLEKTKPSAGAQGELILKDRLLKEYKIYRTSILFEINRILICFKSNFRDTVICYMESIKTCNNNEDCIIKNKQSTIRTYNTLLELSLISIVKPMLIDMIFRNGFPILPAPSSTDSKKYKEELDEFEKKCIEKYNLLLLAFELNMDTDWSDYSINPSAFKHFYHNDNTMAIDYTLKEIINFFKLMIQKRDELIKLVYKDFKKMFNDENECLEYCKFVLRDLYE